MSDPSTDLRAQRAMYEKVFAMAFREARGHVPEEEANEAAHEVASSVLRAWMRDPTRFDEGRNPFGYVRKSVKNRLLNLKRAAGRRHRAEKVHGGDRSDSTVAWSDPDAKLAGEECEEMERRAIDALAPRTQQVYVIAREQHYSYEEIAEQLGMAKGTVHWHVSEGNALVKGALRHYRDTGGMMGGTPTARRQHGRDQQ